MEPIFYFAYGSNLNLERVKSRDLKFTDFFPVYLPDYQLVFNKISRTYPGTRAANIEKADGKFVEGLVYKTDSGSLAKMDVFEGYPEHYIREQIIVFKKENNVPLQATGYIAHPCKISPGKPSKEYLEHLLQGRPFLSEAYFAFLCTFQANF